MTCYHPIEGKYAPWRNSSGKRPIIFNQTGNKLLETVKVPCGQCIGCRLDKSRAWAIRVVKEASLHEDNCFITLTYNDENLPENGSLVKEHFTKFMKRLRKKLSPRKIRYYMCGEYGTKYGRPHYHAVIFNYDFPDKEEIERHNQYRQDLPKLYTSTILSETWGKGYVSIGEVTLDSAAYIARYCTKKITGEAEHENYFNFDIETGEIKERLQEYQTMSRRPGIAADWFDKYGKEEIQVGDYITEKGKKIKVPRYFQDRLEQQDPEAYEVYREKRIEIGKKYSDDNTPERLSQRQKCLWAKIRNLKRGKVEP